MSHIAIDIGGSLLKLVYFLPEEMSEGDTDNKSAKHTGGAARYSCSFHAFSVHCQPVWLVHNLEHL